MYVFVILLMTNKYQSERTPIPPYKAVKRVTKQSATHNTHNAFTNINRNSQKQSHIALLHVECDA